MIASVVGLDLSFTATGWFRHSQNPSQNCNHGVWRVGGEGVARMDAIAKYALKLVLSTDGEPLVVIEGFSFASSGNVAYELGGLGYLVRHALWSRSIPYIEVSPNSLKKFATGSGDSKKIKKEHVIREVWRRWNFEASDNNEADAYVLGRIGMCLTGIDEPTTEFQRDVIDALRKKLPRAGASNE